YPTVNIKVPSPSKNPPAKKLIVKKTGILYDNDGRLPTYKTSSKTRGEVLIINNIMFKGELERKGAKADDENLQNLFKQMGFKVSLKRDLKKKDLESSVENFSKKLAKSSDISVVIVMSHGTTNDVWRGTEVFGVDEKGVLTEDLLQYFSGDKCKNMLNKPKIFIFQCCRGDNEQFIQSDARPVKRQSRPIGDMLIAYSTLPGFVSYRNPESGTWYIQTLCEVFSKHAHEYHVEELLKIVDLELNRFTSSVAQTSSYENRGFKRCYLHPI
ncbi:caspase-7-like, partial [Asbolus verrucosus]